MDAEQQAEFEIQVGRLVPKLADALRQDHTWTSAKGGILAEDGWIDVEVTFKPAPAP